MCAARHKEKAELYHAGHVCGSTTCVYQLQRVPTILQESVAPAATPEDIAQYLRTRKRFLKGRRVFVHVKGLVASEPLNPNNQQTCVSTKAHSEGYIVAYDNFVGKHAKGPAAWKFVAT